MTSKVPLTMNKGFLPQSLLPRIALVMSCSRSPGQT